MKVLVVNIGSTSFKFRVFDMATEEILARGAIEGVGAELATVRTQMGAAAPVEERTEVADQAQAVRWCLAALSERELTFDAVGFKAVHGGPIDRPVRVSDEVLGTMDIYADICPAHNPPYMAAMRAFSEYQPDLPLVAAFETGFHQTIPASRQTYGIPWTWTTEYGVRRYGFHGASHAFIAQRTAELLGRSDLKIVSCHLGGSSSVCAIDAGRSVANSFGVAPQSGLPHNNRVGEFDAYSLPLLSRRTSLSTDELLQAMAKEGGLYGISGFSNDMRTILKEAHSGNERAALARDVFVESVRHYIGAYLVALGGLDALVFTGGIGERSPEIRERVCEGLAFLGIQLEPAANEALSDDGKVSSPGAAVQILALETNEELVVARHTRNVLATGN